MQSLQGKFAPYTGKLPRIRGKLQRGITRVPGWSRPSRVRGMDDATMPAPPTKVAQLVSLEDPLTLELDADEPTTPNGRPPRPCRSKSSRAIRTRSLQSCIETMSSNAACGW
jgi:hypothetical protein